VLEKQTQRVDHCRPVHIPWCSSIADSASLNDAFNRSFQSRAFDWQSESATGFNFEELCNATELPAGTVTVFVMDECQIAYNAKSSLWPIVKATLAQSPKQRNCYFLLLAAYGEGRTTSGPAGTPVELAGCKSMSLSHIRLRTSEREEFFERLRNYPEAAAIYPVPDGTVIPSLWSSISVSFPSSLFSLSPLSVCLWAICRSEVFFFFFFPLPMF